MQYFTCALDLGASGGRVMVGDLNNGKLSLAEVHRFANEPVRMGGVLYWDMPRLFYEIKTGLKKIAAEKIPLASIAIDTWGVDYGLLDAPGNLIGMPVHYRDSRVDTILERSYIDISESYNRTGIQIMNINTLFQLMSDMETRPDILNAAADLLFMPDLFTYYLTGVRINEYTIASTSQLLNAQTQDWDGELISRLKPGGLRRLFKPLTPPGTPVGLLRADVASETGLDASVRVIAAGSHDTASAVAGTPFTGEGSAAYLSCGTWSLLGMELEKTCVTEESRRMNFTNEGGLDGKIRFLKNINGLWLMQQLLKHHNQTLREDKKLGFPELIAAAEKAERAHFRVNPNDASFTNPPDMAEAVRAYCARTGQGEPRGVGEAAMAIYNGLTDEYIAVIGDLEKIQGKPLDTLHMVGGGVRDTLLCRLTARATGKRVTAGPVEASALGNIVAQLIGLGAVSSLKEGREIIRRSFQPTVYEAAHG